MTTIGFLYPGFGAEDDYPYMQSLLPDDVRLELVHTSVGVDSHDVDSLLDLGRPERLADGARELEAHHPDAVIWACTSGSFVFGLDGARDQAARVGEALGIPASSTSLAFVDAIHTLGAESVAIAATYPEPVAVHFRTLLQDAGVTVESLASNGIETAALAGALSPHQVIDLARGIDSTAADVVLLPDTAMHTARELPELEEAAGTPVLTANQVTLWQGLRLAGALTPDLAELPLGRLFALAPTRPFHPPDRVPIR